MNEKIRVRVEKCGNIIYDRTVDNMDEKYPFTLAHKYAPCKVYMHDEKNNIERNPLVFEKGGGEK